MQTFLPYPDLRASCQVLDTARLGKQRVETFQILRALTWPEYAWKNHPAVRMWRGFVPGLVLYGVESCEEWVRRGYADAVLPQLLEWTAGERPVDPPLPPWFGLAALHLSHRSALLRKDPAFYRPLFGDEEPDDLPYLWPPDVYPRWPVRRGGRDLDLGGALAVLGLSSARPGQAEAVAALDDGRDCLLVARPGWGATTAGLLGGLTRPGVTRWVREPDGPLVTEVPDVPLLPAREPVPEPSERTPVVARPPSEIDRDAMRAEAVPPEVLFGTLSEPLPADCSLVVVEGSVAPAALPAERPPALVISPRADAATRAVLATQLGLRSPVHAGGGWDVPDTWLGVETPTTASAARSLLVELVRAHGPAVVVVDGRSRVDRVVAALRGAGLRADGWHPSMRATRQSAAVGAWRSRRLEALAIGPGELPPLGRARIRLLVNADPPADHEAWRDEIEAAAPERAVLLAGPGSPPDIASLAAAPGCRREALLTPYGEPVVVPCGRCERC